MSSDGNVFSTLILFTSMFVLFYFMIIRPRKKKEQELDNMRNNLKIGDIVTTIGGIVGIVISVKNDVITLETGSDKNKIRIKKWGVRDIEKIENENKNNKIDEQLKLEKN